MEQTLAACQLILRFGQIYRLTQDSEGRLESDTTHTLMLAILAGQMAQSEGIGLDLHAVIVMSLLHDLVEAYAGDTPTLIPLTAEQRADKAVREHAALEKIKLDLAGFPIFLGFLLRYEEQACQESRFVRLVDKILPKLTHFLNRCAVPLAHGFGSDDLHRTHQQHLNAMRHLEPVFPRAFKLFEEVSIRSANLLL